MSLFSALNREQKEAIGLLQIGSFLEYFDLLLYVHMAVLLNDIFFPKTDPYTASLLSAFAFCSTYVFRPVGALIFGWMGDNIGRKSTIIFTTVLMSFSCIVMANLPTYAQIGITATWVMTFCRMAQGMSSMGEMVGAEIYVTESVKRPECYPAVAFINVACSIGAMVALGIATLVTTYLLNWRLAFWVGAGIALVGAVARTRLRETPDFLEMKRKKMAEAVAEINTEDENDNPKETKLERKSTWKEPIKKKTVMSYFMIACGWPLSLYLAFIYFNTTLKTDFGYSSEAIIKHNFLLSVILVASEICWSFLSYHIHPIRIIKARSRLLLLFMIALPFLLTVLSSPYQLFGLQATILILTLYGIPAEAVLIYHLPIYRRFTYASFLYALSRAVMYIITSFGLVYLGTYFGPFGLWFIAFPILGAYLYGVSHFEDLERKAGIYPNLVRAA